MNQRKINLAESGHDCPVLYVAKVELNSSQTQSTGIKIKIRNYDTQKLKKVSYICCLFFEVSWSFGNVASKFLKLVVIKLSAPWIG